MIQQQQQPVMIAAAPINYAAGNTILVNAASNDRQSHSEASRKAANELFSSVSYCLLFIGIVDVVFGCLDLLTGLAALAMGSYFAWFFTYVWAGFVFAIVNGALVLRARAQQPQLNHHWTIVLFAFGIATLIFHLIDFAVVLASVISLGTGDTVQSKFTSTYVGNANGWTYNLYYHIQSSLMAEAPRLVLVTSLVASDIWQLVLSVKLRRYFRQTEPNATSNLPEPEPKSLHSEASEQVPINRNYSAENVSKLASASTALCLAGAINIMFGCLDLIVGVLELVKLDDKWLPALYSVFGVFLFAILNGSLTIHAARRSPLEIHHWRTSMLLFGILSLIVNVIGLVIAVVTIAMLNTFTPALINQYSYRNNGAYDYQYCYYYTFVNPATLDAARLVTLLSLFTASVIQLFAVSKIRACFRNCLPTASPLPSVSTVNGGFVPGQFLIVPLTGALPQNFYNAHQIQTPLFAMPQYAYATAVHQQVVVSNAEVNSSQPPAYST